MRSKTLLFGSFIAFLAVPAMAQGNNAINVFGTVDKVDATSISVKSDDGGQMQTFKLAPNVLYIKQSPAKLSDIKNNDFVASAAVRKDDGKLHSTELRIFSEKMLVERTKTVCLGSTAEVSELFQGILLTAS